MEMLFGLPAHPLIIHFPIVAIPAFALAVLLWVAKPWANTSASLGLAVFGVVTAVSTILAASSGEAFSELLSSGESINRHRELGETLRLIVILQAVAVISSVVIAANGKFGKTHSLARAFRVLSGIASVLAVIWVIRVGHEGASQTWGFLS